jgi:hypothetical protein
MKKGIGYEKDRRRSLVRVTVDIFSGQPNPTWVLDDDEAKGFLDEITESRNAIGESESGYRGLGYRGMKIDLLAGHLQDEYKIPSRFTIANGTAKDESKGRKIAKGLVSKIQEYAKRNEDSKANNDAVFEHPFLEASKLESVIKTEMEKLPMAIEPLVLPFFPMTVKDCIKTTVTTEACEIELAWYLPGFWNDDTNVRWNNNCYNYATNRRTDTFAQPGRGGGGYPWSDPISCGVIKAAAIKYDGAHRRCECFPKSERPRYLMALAVWPGVDYHWYRKHIGGFWGHKPGSTEARNIDNSGLVIHDPEACDRGPYTDFCGYLYSCKSMKVL